MSKKHRTSKADRGSASQPGSDTSAQSEDRSGRKRPRTPKNTGWLGPKRPVFQFVAIFAVLMGIFYALDYTALARETVMPAYLRFNAGVSGSLLGIFEDSVTVTGKSIRSPRYSLSIERGCDAVEPSALFLAGVLAFPATLASKIPGMLIGTLCLMAINLFRIISLFYVGIYWPKAFHVMHVDVWQALFIFLAILFWTLWALRATRPIGPINNASSTGRN